MEISKVLGQKVTAKNIFRFISDVYHSQKLVEFLSFIVWEFKYQFHLYGNHQVLKFNNKNPLTILTQNRKRPKIKSNGFQISQSRVNWALVFIDNSQNLWGSIIGAESTLCQLSPEGDQINSFEFEDKILGLYINKAENVFCCVKGILYKFEHIKKSFKKVLKFSTPHSYFRQEAFTETPKGELLIGEYANIFKEKKWKFVGYIYHSLDNGNSWKKIDFLQKTGINKHVHILKWSHLINGLILTDGDNQKNIWLNKSNKHFDRLSSTPKLGWKKLNKFHIQKGGYTGIAELSDKIIFGTDYNGGTNFLISTNDMIHFDEKVIPDPYRRAIFNRIAIRKKEKNKYEIWSTLKFTHSIKIKSLVMLSTDSGKSWKKIIEYDGTQFEINIISNATEITNEIYLKIQDKKDNMATTIYIHS